MCRHALQVPLVDSQPIMVMERILKLSLPCMYVWLTMFYLFFHLWLNIIAEITYFADREFYKDWWNAKTIGEYWRLWNMPVHKWMIRCVYSPVVSACTFLLQFVPTSLPMPMLNTWPFA
jgi:D-alanyl-lipoteichoic acid acyltransferase DltB (MBOAT superfamily)